MSFSKQVLASVGAAVTVAAGGTYVVWAWEDTVRPRFAGFVQTALESQSIDFGVRALSKEVDGLTKQVETLKEHDHGKIDLGKIHSRLDALERASKLGEGGNASIGVKLYMSTIENESSLIVLNGNNPKIAQFVKYGQLYQASVVGGLNCENGCATDALRAELRNLDADDASSYEAIGRIPARQYDKLNGRSRHRVDALIELAPT